MISTSVSRLVEAVADIRPRGSGSPTFTGVAFDSRAVRGGELFIALVGENDDGHRFVADALARGAALALVERENIPDVPPETLLVTTSALKTFQTIANWWRRECGTPIVAVTGSVGKTTIKEMAAKILLQTGVGLYSQKSFNNHVGVPFTLCHLRPDHNWAVLEMGMNHAGELRTITKIGEPNAALIACIAPAHIENFGTLEGIARAKLEILEGLKSTTGIAMLNGDDALLLSEYEACAAKPQTSLYFGGEDCRLLCVARFSKVVSHGLAGIQFDLEIAELAEKRSISMPVIGIHNARNAAAAVTAALSVVPALTFDQIQKGLESYTSSVMRLEVHECNDNSQVVDDSYNANPASMMALVDIAAELCREGKRVGLVLGDMRELGEVGNSAHSELGASVAAINPAFVVGCGSFAAAIIEPSAEQGIDTAVAAAPADAARAALTRSWDVLLVKASRSVGLDEVVKIVLAERGERHPQSGF